MENFQKLDKKVKIAIISFILIFAFIIIYSFASLLSHSGKVKTTIKYAPFAATITLNGQKVKNNSEIWLETGNYNISISYEHFDTIEYSTKIDKDNHYIVGILLANDEEGEAYAKKHQNEFISVEGLSGKILNEAGEREIKKYPILARLPLNNSLYSISYSYNDQDIPVILIKADENYIDTAVAKMKSFEGVELTDYIITTSLKNPYQNPSSTSQNQNPIQYLTEIYNLSSKYHIAEGETIDDYYVTTINRYDYDSDLSFAHYRVILHRTGNSWELAATPQLIFTKDNTPNLSIDILKRANAL